MRTAVMKIAAAVAAAVVLAVGAKAIAKSDPASSSGGAGTRTEQTTSNPETPARPSMRPGMGSAVTGTDDGRWGRGARPQDGFGPGGPPTGTPS